MKHPFKYEEFTSKIIGAAMTVHRELGTGFQERIYQRALSIEFAAASLAHKREFSMPIRYRDQHIGSRRVDFLVEEVISVEIKAVTKLEPVHLAQAINYLEAYHLEVGLLINFGAESLEFKRLCNKKHKPQSDKSHQSA